MEPPYTLIAFVYVRVHYNNVEDIIHPLCRENYIGIYDIEYE